MDVTANQDEISDNETFQLEFQADSGKWNFRTLQDKYGLVVAINQNNTCKLLNY